jgi:hypothetical protein
VVFEGVKESSRVSIVHCAQFDPFCAGMTPTTLREFYDHRYVTPRYYPNNSAAAAEYNTRKISKQLGQAINKSDWEMVSRLRLGVNVRPPSVGIIYDGWVTKSGSVLSSDRFLPHWPDSSNVTRFNLEVFPPYINQSALVPFNEFLC